MVSFGSFRAVDGVPIYLQIQTYIRRGCVAGTIRDGDELPSRRVLSALLGVNPNTVQKAFRLLEDEGLIASHSGAKSYVTVDEGKLAALRQTLLREELRARDALAAADGHCAGGRAAPHFGILGGNVMRKHLSVFALCIRAKLWKLLLTLAAAAGISTAAFFILGLERAWGNGGGPGILALRILFVLSYIAVMITCFSPDTKRVKTCYFLQRLQISERAFLLWDALAAALCFLLFYCAQILTVFGLACVYQRSAGYALGPQGVFLMLARDSFLHGLLPFGESVIWDAQHPLHGLRGA